MLLGLLFLFSSTASAASAVLGVDLGTEYIKAALVKPGIPLEIVLTKDSRRKETSAIAFKPSKSGALPEGSFPERFYGADAIALQARFPGDVYPNLKHLLGVSSDSDAVKTYNGRYPALEVRGTEGRKTVSFKSSIFSAEEEKSFSVEEVLAMVLKNVRENAKALAGTGYDVQDVVFTVPPFYNVAERRALEVSAKLAGLKVLSVVSDGVAVGINYATGRVFPTVNGKEAGKPEINLVFDMGAGSASATVLQFQGRSVKDVGKRNKTVQEVNVLGASWDRTLGGDALNSLIVDDIINTFLELPAAKSVSITAEKINTHGRTAAKLFKEAERIRQVLSANQATQASFEALFEDIDLKYKLDRTKFEQLTSEVSARVDVPIKKALEAAGLTIEDIDSVIVHGGATRTPFVQARLEAVAGKDKIRANVNSDEAAVFGAAFKAAGLSPSFRVKEIRDSDTQGYNHGIEYKHNLKTRDQKIFTPSTKLGATKDLPFNMMGEFEFTVYQSIPDAKGKEVKEPTLLFKSLNLTSTVTKLIDTDGCDRDSFNNYVQVRLSPVTGTPEVTSAWVTCEATDDSKGGIVDGVKNLFGMGGKKDQEALKEDDTSSESAPASASKSSSSSKSSKSSKSSSAVAAEASDDGKPKKKTVRSAITYDVKQLGYEKHARKDFKKMQDRLAAFDASDKARRVREEVLNSLEAFTYRARDYFDDDDFVAVSTEATRTELENRLNAASDWVYSDGPNADEKTLRAKLKELEDIVNPILRRRRQSWKRPGAVTDLEETIGGMKEVVELVNNQIAERATYSSKSAEAASKSSASPSPSPSVDPLDELEEEDLESAPSASATPEIEEVPEIYTEEDRTKIEDVTDKAKKWLEETRAKQDKLQGHEEPVLTVEELKYQKKQLDDVVMEMMMKKMKHFKPPKPKATTKPKAKKASKVKKSKTEKPTETPVAPKEGEAETEQPDAQSQADHQREEIENDGPNMESHGGRGPTEQELKEALEKAGVKWDPEKYKNYVGKENHDEL
ncbi:heat shock protein 70-like protein-like protein [Macroventuria anomochaeta]|uniref:Heat shock protein 70-like protein-like protein n=1 Tax=Macroventuria anomochaeta TaxID=301207 RepID=A0ACB6RSS4_9PLEO|nr:heat shock protein 70-like protein-like protein [Macroventuria anomochaeta]KAF2624946.1 heat shock protein 70-like protein-like protein [Macroventuria anomochaeta]